MTSATGNYYLLAKRRGELTDQEYRRLLTKLKMLCKHPEKFVSGDFYLCRDCGKEL